ncbi:MAG: DUF2961 domain-containing protein [Kiritimatiellia bacterium]|nr:DUF2961 domain-containing protein [Kiritimatiellia bacterium]
MLRITWGNAKNPSVLVPLGDFFGDVPFGLRVSDRDHAVYQRKQGSFSQFSRPDQDGWRCVRSAP